MLDALINHEIAGAREIEATICAMHAADIDFLVSSSMVAQVIQ